MSASPKTLLLFTVFSEPKTAQVFLSDIMCCVQLAYIANNNLITTAIKFQTHNINERERMSENSPTKTFQQRVDEFIALANQQAADSSVDDANTSILFSAARFNAFSVARSVESAENLQAEKQAAIEYFTQRYAEMLNQNLEEHIARFDSFRQK
jgi:uncharacterized protein DUF3144